MSYDLELFDQTILDNDAQLLNQQTFQGMVLAIKHHALKCQTEEELRIFAQFRQANLLSFKDSPLCAGWADKLLFFMENNFRKHLDADLAISDLGKQHELKPHYDQLDEVKQKGARIFGPELIKVMKPLFEICQQKSPSLHEVRYLKQLCLEWDLQEGTALESEAEMVQFLYHMNYNTHSFLRFLAMGIRERYKGEECPRVRSEVLTELRFEFMGSKTASLGFVARSPSIAEQLEEWRNAELNDCFKKMEQHGLEPPKVVAPPTKLKMSRPLTELVVMTRCMKECGFIVNETEKEVCQAISELFSTPRSEELSVASITNKFYTNDRVVIEEVRGHFLQMAQCLNQVLSGGGWVGVNLPNKAAMR